MIPESFDPATNEHVLVLANGYQIRSGWIDCDDPDALPAGDYLSVFDADGNQVFYTDASDFFADAIAGRQLLWQLIQSCINPNSESDINVANNCEIGDDTAT